MVISDRVRALHHPLMSSGACDYMFDVSPARPQQADCQSVCARGDAGDPHGAALRLFEADYQISRERLVVVRKVIFGRGFGQVVRGVEAIQESSLQGLGLFCSSCDVFPIYEKWSVPLVGG